MRSAYLAEAVSKRVSKLDSGEGVFEANGMAKWEPGRSDVVGRRKKAREARCVAVAAYVLVTHSSWPVHPVPMHSSARC